MIDIAIVSGRPADGTPLPKTEKHQWNEIRRVLREDIYKFSPDTFRFFIPVYSKFDLEVLRLAKRYGHPVRFYIPDARWGESMLPQFQIDLVKSMKTDDNIRLCPGGIKDRIRTMTNEADVAYVFEGTQGVEAIYPDDDTPVTTFPQDQILPEQPEAPADAPAVSKEEVQSWMSHLSL